MRNFTFSELIASDTAKVRGINNMPKEINIIDNLDALVENILQPLRNAYGKPIYVNSGYRCEALNKAVGGVANSQHLTGEAADIRPAAVNGQQSTVNEVKRLGKLIQSLNLPFDQLIYEGTWIHVSYGPRNRKQVLYK